MFQTWQYVALPAVGVVAGVLGGLLGLGGSVVMIPAMLWMLGTMFNGREGIHQYQAAAMIVNFFLIIPSVRAHAKKHAIWAGVWRWLVPSALVGIAAGVFVSYLPFLAGGQAKYMRYLMGVFFLYVIYNNVRKLLPRSGGEGVSREIAEAYPWYRKSAVGFPMGLLAGLLGIGGGAVAVPAQEVVLRMPLRNSIATSAATIMCIAWLGAILKNVQLGDNGSWEVSAMLAALLAPTAMVGSYFGGHLTHTLPVRWVRVAFIALMVASVLRIFWDVLAPLAG